MDRKLQTYYKMIKNMKEQDLKPIGFTLEYYYENRTENYNSTPINFKCPTCGDIFTRTYKGAIKGRYKGCLDCNKKNYKRGRALSLDELRKRVAEKGLTLISDYYKNPQTKIKVMCSCGEIFETTYDSIRVNNNQYGVMLCEECNKERSRNRHKAPYEEIKKYFEDNGCVLLSKKEEYLNNNSKLRYIAKCGHEHITQFQPFKRSKYKVCKECRIKLNSGENTYNWKGGVYDSEKETFRKTYEFKKWRSDVYKRDNYTCQCCGAKRGKLNAHHLDGYNWYTEGRTDINNGITLCEDCHMNFHNTYGYGNNTKEQFEEYMNNKIKL